MLEQERVQGRASEQLEARVASVQETAMQARAHQPGRQRVGGPGQRVGGVSCPPSHPTEELNRTT